LKFIKYYKNNLLFLYCINKNRKIKMGIGDWGLGIGDWGLGVGGPAPKPKTQKPKPQTQKIKLI